MCLCVCVCVYVCVFVCVCVCVCACNIGNYTTTHDIGTGRDRYALIVMELVYWSVCSSRMRGGDEVEGVKRGGDRYFSPLHVSLY